MPYIPPYQQIVEHYREQLRTGQLQQGDQLPTVRTIAAHWEVSRVTVGKALSALRLEGLIATDGRNGTRVAINSRIQNALAMPVILAELPPVSEELARRLGVRPGVCLLLLQISAGHDVVQELPDPRTDRLHQQEEDGQSDHPAHQLT